MAKSSGFAGGLILCVLFAGSADGQDAGGTEQGSAIGPWQRVSHASLLDDTSRDGIISLAQKTEGSFNGVPFLMVACGGKALRYAVHLNGEVLKLKNGKPLYNGLVADFKLRHDKEKVYPRLAVPHGDTLFLEVNAKGMFEALSRTNELTVGIELAGGTTIVAVFPVTEFVKATEPILRSCKAF